MRVHLQTIDFQCSAELIRIIALEGAHCVVTFNQTPQLWLKTPTAALLQTLQQEIRKDEVD
jgi:hypothetical protein